MVYATEICLSRCTTLNCITSKKISALITWFERVVEIAIIMNHNREEWKRWWFSNSKACKVGENVRWMPAPHYHLKPQLHNCYVALQNIFSWGYEEEWKILGVKRNKETNLGSGKSCNKGENSACCLSMNFFQFLLFIKPPFLKTKGIQDCLLRPSSPQRTSVLMDWA